MTAANPLSILIVGAGPSGLLLALLLAKHGIPTTVFEAGTTVDSRPRAAVYGTPAMPDLARAGILDEIRDSGFSISSWTWRTPSHEVIATLDGNAVRNVDGMDMRSACLGLNELTNLMARKYEALGGKIHWGHKVVNVGETDTEAFIVVETPEGEKKFEGSYIVGADGATSTVRKSVFGKEFPGFTWDRQIVATNVYYPFADKFGWDDVNFVIHPTNFFLACRLTKDGLYRVTYGEEGNISDAEIAARQPARFREFLPGNPEPSDYTLTNISPYKMHQRCASSFRKGRVLLVADAAHVCNPWGGLGITGGFVDVGGLFDCLVGIWEGVADDSILDLYSEIRIKKYKEVIDVISQDNFRRVADENPETIFERDEFLQLVKRLETDIEANKAFQLEMNVVRYDFTQHYKRPLSK